MELLRSFVVVLMFAISAQASWCPFGWEAFEDLCYYKIDNAQTYPDAQESCRSIGGTLAIIPTPAANEFVRNMMVGASYWVGLESQDWGIRPQYWDDDSEVYFTNWTPGEPRDVSGIEECTEIYKSNSKWNDLACTNLRNFICSREADKEEVTKVVCPAGWEGYDNMCYYKVDVALTYEDAQTRCERIGGNLATIPDVGANEFIHKNMELSQASYWTGLRSTDFDIRPQHWKDGSVVAYTNWYPGRPDDAGGIEECVEFYKTWGSWNDLRCDSLRAFLCSRPAEKPEDTPQVECAPGWEQFLDMCYYKIDVLLTYEDAQERCENIGADLAALPTTGANDFVKRKLGLVHSTYWIGLRNPDWDTWPLHWNDGHEVEYTNWHSGQPNDAGGVEECAEMYKVHGTWNDLACTNKRAFICSKHAEKWPENLPRLQCPPGWEALEDNCYSKFDSLKTFQEAQDLCEEENANLAIVIDTGVNEFVKSRLGLTAASYWIGLTDPDWDVRPQYWLDGQVVTYTNWHAGQPNDVGGKEECAELYKTHGTWGDITCDQKRNFICSKPADEIDEEAEECSKGWTEFQDYCYFFIKDPQTVEDAQGRCEMSGGDLATIPDAWANELLRTKMGLPNGYYWIGLSEPDWDIRPQFWNDGSVVSYTSWQTGEPNNRGGNEECAAYYQNYGKWYDLACNGMRHYICSKRPGDGYDKTPTRPEGNVEEIEEDIEELKKEVEELNEDNEQLQGENENLNSQNQELSKEVEDLEEQNVALEEDLENCEDESEGLEQEVGELREEHDELNQENEELLATNEQQNEEINSLNEEVYKLKDTLAQLEEEAEEKCKERGPDEGWVDGYNGFQYMSTPEEQSWFESKTICQSMGGMLASSGIKDPTLRKPIGKALKLTTAWIGLNDLNEEGKHVWMDNGEEGTDENINWKKKQPDGGAAENCDLIAAGPKNEFQVHDRACTDEKAGLCEKPL